jgi:hypothetical protein
MGHEASGHPDLIRTTPAPPLAGETRPNGMCFSERTRRLIRLASTTWTSTTRGSLRTAGSASAPQPCSSGKRGPSGWRSIRSRETAVSALTRSEIELLAARLQRWWDTTTGGSDDFLLWYYGPDRPCPHVECSFTFLLRHPHKPGHADLFKAIGGYVAALKLVGG